MAHYLIHPLGRKMYHIKQIKMKYVIIPSSELSNIDFSQVLETSASTLRYSLDSSEFLLKFKGDTPSFLEGKTEYDYSAIMDILNGSNWSEI
jgi:hypothetical protein